MTGRWRQAFGVDAVRNAHDRHVGILPRERLSQPVSGGNDPMGRPEGKLFQRRQERAEDPGPKSRVRVPDLRQRPRPGIPEIDPPTHRAPDRGHPRHQVGGVRRAAAHDNLRLESPDQRPRAQRRSQHPAAALVRKGQECRELPIQLAQQTRRRQRGDPRRGRERPARSPKGQPAKQPQAVDRRPEPRTPLDPRAGRRMICPDRRGGGDDGNRPAEPAQVFRYAQPAEATDGTIGTEVIRDDEQPARVAHGLASDTRRPAIIRSRKAANRSRCRSRQASP